MQRSVLVAIFGIGGGVTFFLSLLVFLAIGFSGKGRIESAEMWLFVTWPFRQEWWTVYGVSGLILSALLGAYFGWLQFNQYDKNE